MLSLRAGRIQGVCAAGYLCVSGSADFTPQGSVSNLTQCQWGMQCAGPCPPGTVDCNNSLKPQLSTNKALVPGISYIGLVETGDVTILSLNS